MKEVINYQELALVKQVDLINLIRAREFEINSIKQKEKDISLKRKQMEIELDDFKQKIKTVLEDNGIEKIETEVGKIQIMKNPISVEIVNEVIVPNEYKKVETVTKIDKKKIAENFKETGELIEGVIIHTDETRLSIK